MAKGYTVKLAFLDVGHADTIVVSLPETQEAVIVDCVDAKAVMGYLKQEEIKHIRGLIITHLHRDHYREAVLLLDNCASQLNVSCERVLYNNIAKVSKTGTDKLLSDDDHHGDPDTGNERENRGIQRYILENFTKWTTENVQSCQPLIRVPGKPRQPVVGGVIGKVIEVLGPYHGQLMALQDMGLNNTSAVLRIQGAATNALLTGDIEPKGWEVLRRNAVDVGATVLKFPHHGAWKNSDARSLLEQVEPSYVVISVGKNGNPGYDHPNKHVLEAISERPNTTLFCTEVTSRCRAVVAGSAWKFSPVPRVSPVGTPSARYMMDTLHVPRIPRACACGGDVIIELGKEVRILQPPN
jgi:beta-lactamase superfamily II metal-dependent hydrolase